MIFSFYRQSPSKLTFYKHDLRPKESGWLNLFTNLNMFNSKLQSGKVDVLGDVLTPFLQSKNKPDVNNIRANYGVSPVTFKDNHFYDKSSGPIMHRFKGSIIRDPGAQSHFITLRKTSGFMDSDYNTWGGYWFLWKAVRIFCIWHITDHYRVTFLFLK